MLQDSRKGWFSGLLGNDEEERRLRLQALGAFGTGLLESSGWSTMPVSLGQAMGRGMQYGAQAYDQGQEKLARDKEVAEQKAMAAQKAQQEEAAKKQLQELIASGEQITPQLAMQIVSANPSLSNIVQQAMKNAQPDKFGAAPQTVNVAGVDYYNGGDGWKPIPKDKPVAARAERLSALEEKILAAREMGASEEEIRLMVLGRSGKDSSSGGRALPVSVVDKIGGAGTKAETMNRLVSGFKPEFTGGVLGLPIGGNAINTLGRLTGDDTGRTQWWQDYQGYINQVRNELFGAALTAQEKAEFEKAVVTPNMDPNEAQKNLARQRELSAKAVERIANPYRAMGYDGKAIDAAVGMSQPESGAPAPGAVVDGYRFKGGDPSDPNNWEQL